MWSDPIVDEVRRIRDEYAARFNYDMDAIYADIRAAQERRGGEIIRFAPRHPGAPAGPESVPPLKDNLAVAEAAQQYAPSRDETPTAIEEKGNSAARDK